MDKSLPLNILILEDEDLRKAHFRRKFMTEKVTIVSTSKECISQLQNGQWDALFLDHDLGMATGEFDPGTGYDVAKWLNENLNNKPPQVIIHSLNPVGAKNMNELIPDSILAPFIWLHR